MDFVILGATSFLVFLVYIVATRIGADPSPYRKLAKVHLRFSLLYFALGGYWIFRFSTASWVEFFLGLFTYFALQYAFFTHIFATLIRGFSTNICVTLFRHGGRASLSTIFADFADGKGIDYVKDERIRVLIESSALAVRDGKLALTSFGRRTAILNRWILKIWNLEYLGMDRVRGKLHEGAAHE